MSDKGFAHIFLVIIIALFGVLLFFPLPQYNSGNANCLLVDKCPKAGWSWKPSLFKKITSKFATSNNANLTDNSVTKQSPVPVVNWKTYTNKEFGYTLNYPENWIYQEYVNPLKLDDLHQIVFIHETDTKEYTDGFNHPLPPLTITISSDDPSSNWDRKYFDRYEKEEIMLGQKSVSKITATDTKAGFTDVVVITKNYGQFYLFLANGEEESSKLFNQILSTFEFIETEAPPSF